MIHHTYDIYYDEEGDFLEITFGEPPEIEYSEELEDGVIVTKDGSTNEVKAIGIVGFKKRSNLLKRFLEKINVKIPLQITV